MFFRDVTELRWLRHHPILGVLAVGLPTGLVLGVLLSLMYEDPSYLLRYVVAGVLLFGPLFRWGALRRLRRLEQQASSISA